MILNISLTVIDLYIDSSIILDFFILDLLSFRNFSFVGSPELVGVVEQKGGSRWLLSEFLLFFLLLLLFFLDFTLLILLLLVFLLLDVSRHLSIILFLLCVWLLFKLLRAFWLFKVIPWRLTVLSPPWLEIGLWGFLTSPVGNWVNHIVNSNPDIWSNFLIGNISSVLVNVGVLLIER